MLDSKVLAPLYKTLSDLLVKAETRLLAEFNVKGAVALEDGWVLRFFPHSKPALAASRNGEAGIAIASAPPEVRVLAAKRMDTLYAVLREEEKRVMEDAQSACADLEKVLELHLPEPTKDKGER